MPYIEMKRSEIEMSTAGRSAKRNLCASLLAAEALFFYEYRADALHRDGAKRMGGVNNYLRIFVKDVKLKEQNVSIETAKSVQFNVKVTPELADNPKISWQSGNNTVASIDDSGIITV